MAEYENNSDYSNDWYTPRHLFDEMGILFDLDPCSPGINHWVPSKAVFTKIDDGLKQEWFGVVFMNPPFNGRHGHLPWLNRFIDHGNGVAIVRAYTSSGWFQDYIPKMDAICFPRGKTKFVRPNGEIGKAPGHGIALLAIGGVGSKAIERVNGLYFRVGVGLTGS